MDAPPEKENCSTFIQVAKIFSEMKLNVPKLIKTSLDEGFILMTDFGNEQYLDILNSNVSQNNTQYKDAINTLLNMQKKGKAYQEMFSPYAESLIRKEMNLFIDWFIEHHHGYRLSKSETENWLDCLNILTQNAISQPQVLVHRDYHSRNLMFLDSNNPGILDFQDAVIGPITYDLVSLLRDCYISLNLDVVADFSLYFYKNLDEEDKAGISHHQFTKFFDLMGIQRHLKAVGIFTKIKYQR
jgi:Predicted phosphotransferase related to Ser/Thr protein kinases